MKKPGINKVTRSIGVLGTCAFALVYIASPSWPTPDKIFVFLLLLFLALGQSWEFFKKFAPFVVAILAYESFRGVANQLNTRVEYIWMVRADEWLWRLFGSDQLPTVWLQDRLWNGAVQWYDFGLYFVYMLHFVLPFALAILIWKKKAQYYWQYVWSFVSLSFMGFITFLAFPAAPPWLASEKGIIAPITRVSSQVWSRLGISDFPSVYNKLSPNPVAAVPSLHAAYATLISIFVWKVFGKKWGIISVIYPSLIYFGTVYQGEHYLIDELIGSLYAATIFLAVAQLFKYRRLQQQKTAVRAHNAKRITATSDLGVSFSLLACRDYSVDWRHALQNTIDLGFKRFRLMSYWKVIEKQKGVYDFSDLDEQIEIIKKSGGRVSLSIGMKQPRWPETHIPQWAKTLDVASTTRHYISFHRAIIERYKEEECIESWQLENEFWLRSFGEHVDFSRRRLTKEFNLLRELDPDRPIIMTLARVLSLPLRRPTPDIYGTSMYRVIYNTDKKKYTDTWAKPWVYKLKKFLIKLVKNRELVVHELQTEPWGPEANWEISTAEQNKSMSVHEIEKAIVYARASSIGYIDMWGAEWWYWRAKQSDDKSLLSAVARIVEPTTKDVA